ncbi:hypothetical protein GGI15_002250 [Coemansia interrupta]|uniref:Uncharacterized protein n=1 Tax=Coemansia interrupta TaxID=1126814 RepID=A0A9W8LKR3_9FUNG|nr:hypothetical protein GGI15_002250 [Coemansia interrupta]
MLDKLPASVIQQIGRYLRAWTYSQPSLQSYAHTCRRIYPLVIRQAYEYFSLSDVLLPSTLHHPSSWLPRFAAVQRHLTRVLISDSPKIPAEIWENALQELEKLQWSHVRMLSFEIDGIRNEGNVASMLVGFAKRHLAHVDELWLGVDGRLRFFDPANDPSDAFSRVTELRVIGRYSDTPPPATRDTLAQMPRLATVHLDASACLLTTMGDLVSRQHETLSVLSIDAYSAALAHTLRLSSESPWLSYPALHKLTLSIAHTFANLLDSRRVPRLALLSSSHAHYPVSARGVHLLRDRPETLLAGQRFAGLRVLAVDALTLGDVHALGASAGHSLDALSVGGLFADVQLADEAQGSSEDFTPAVCMDAPTMAHVLRTCPALSDLRLLVPPAYEDAYNGTPAPATPTCVFERPPMAAPVVWPGHQALRHVCVHAWAMTFDQALMLARSLPQLLSLDWVLRMAHASDGLMDVGRGDGGRLAHVSVAHTVAVRLKHAFKAALLRFAAALQGPLRVLDVYGGLDVLGLAGAVGRVCPGCTATFYPLVPSWADTATSEEEGDDDDGGGG